MPDRCWYASDPVELNTDRRDITRRIITTIQIILSPFMYLLIFILYVYQRALTAFLNCRPRSSKLSKRSKLAQAGESSTVSPSLAR